MPLCGDPTHTHRNLKYPWMFWNRAEQNLVFAYRSELSRELIEHAFPLLLPSQKPSKRIPAWYALSARKGFWAGNYFWRSVRFLILSSMPWIITKKYVLAYCLLWKRENLLFSMFPSPNMHCTIPSLPHLQAAKNSKTENICLFSFNYIHPPVINSYLPWQFICKYSTFKTKTKIIT